MDPLIRDGFELKRASFQYPKNFADLGAYGKHCATICDLFANGGLTVKKISAILGDDAGTIIRTLIAQHVVRDRRPEFGRSPSGEERRSRLPAWLATEPPPDRFKPPQSESKPPKRIGKE